MYFFKKNKIKNKKEKEEWNKMKEDWYIYIYIVCENVEVGA
jgi:hypothetical protein